MSRRYLAALCLGLAAVACRPGGAPDYFPLAAGTKSYMRIVTRTVAGKDTTQTSEVRLVSVVLGPQKLPGLGRVWVIETPHDSGPAMRSYFRKTSNSVVQVIPRKGKPPLKLLFLSLPLATGRYWFDTEEEHQRFEVVAQETLRLEAGVFPDCFKIASVHSKIDWAMHQWFAPGVGPVKWESRMVRQKAGVVHEQYRRAELVRYERP